MNANSPRDTRGFYFNPMSALWKINREQVLLLGGVRTLLMQIAHPMVAEAVYDHSTVFTAPVRRLFRTLHLTLSLVYGTKSQVMEAARTINMTHQRVRGTVSDTVGQHEAGSEYSALNPDYLLWVYATLVEGALTGYERFVGPLTQAEKQSFHDDGKRFADLLGLRPAHMPESIGDLYGYMDRMIADGHVQVTPKARLIAPVILGQTPFILRPVSFLPGRVTVGLLPEPLRRQYGFSLAPFEMVALDAFSAAVRALVPTLPGAVRFFPQYRRAIRLLHQQQREAA